MCVVGCVCERVSWVYADDSLLQLMIAKSPVSGRDGFVVSIEDKGLVLDWMATGTHCMGC